MAVSVNDNTILLYFWNSSTVFECKRVIGIFSQVRGQMFAVVKAEVVAQGTCMSTYTPHVTLKSPEISGNKS